MSGNADIFDNRHWLYNKHMLKDYQAGVHTSDSFSNTNYLQMRDEISFEHFVPPTNQTASSPSASGSPDLSLSQRDGSSPSPRKDKSRKAKQSPTPEDDTPENKSRRRREQNRIAQRTFRERKDRYIQSLETHIKMLDASHKNLQESYMQSTDQINALYTQLIEAQEELDYWRCLAHPPTTPIVTSGSVMHHQHHSSTETTTPVMTPDMHASVTARHNGHITAMPGMHMHHGHFT